MKKNSFSFVAVIVTLALSGGAATATGCGGVSTSSFCEDVCACQRCTSNDLETCKTQGDNAADQADAAGCSSQFDDFLTCASAHVSCKDDQAVFDECDAQTLALSKCSSAINVLGKNACELAGDAVAAKITNCGGMVTTSSSAGGSTVDCTPMIAALATCQAACINAAACTVLVNDPNQPATSEQAQAVADCLTKCQ